jgi:hypothetical protein
MDIISEFQVYITLQAAFELFFLLMIGHAIADYALQNDFMAAAKNHTTELGKTYWKWVLPAHGLIHAGFVYIIAGSFVLALAEFVVHSVTDYLKCDGKIGFQTDQWIHVGCKVVWVLLLAFEVPFILE